MRKLMTTAGLAVALLAGPAFAASDAQTSTTGADAARTGSAAAPGSATGGGSASSEGSAATSTSSGMTDSGSAASTSDTGADPARTGSAAAPGSATGGGSAETQSGTSSTTTTMGSTPGTAGAAATERTFTTSELHELIGQEVQNAGGEDIGEVNDVVMVDGRPVLVVGVGGFLGLGAKEVTVPYEEATMSSDGVQVNMTQDQLKQQPEYDAESTAGVSIKDTYKQ